MNTAFKTITASVMAAALLGGLAACSAPSDSGAAHTGSGDPVTLKVATQAGPENWKTQALQVYADTVEELTDGSVQFEFYYSDALVSAREQADALHNGVIDLAWTLLSYTPDKFPVSEWVSEAAFIHDSSPDAGTLQGVAATMDWAFAESAVSDEFAAAGIMPLIPRVLTHEAYGIACRDEVTSAADLVGLRARVGGAAWAQEAENLGMVPVDIPFTETYTAFQQGLVDCFIGGATDVDVLNLADHADTFIAAGMTGYDSVGLHTSVQTWESLSLEQQQAMWDALPAYIESWYGSFREANFAFIDRAAEAGMTIVPAPADVAQKVRTYHESVVAGMGDSSPASVVDPAASFAAYEDITAKWLDRVIELGYSAEDGTWAEMAGRENGTPGDLGPWVDAIETEILSKYRPE